MYVVELKNKLYGPFNTKSDAWAWISCRFPDSDFTVRYLNQI